jgi:glycosyltransferase involved in cell wall biosynthesis
MLDRFSIYNHGTLRKRLYWLLRGSYIANAPAIQCGNATEIRNAIPWIRSARKFILGNGIEAARLDDFPATGAFRAHHNIPSDAPLALFMSRLHPKKGLDRLLPAWRHVLHTVPNAVFAIAGSGDAQYVAGIDALIRQLDAGDRVRRVGQLKGVNKWEALVDADLFVLPSHQEGFPMAVTEAMGASCPVVITQECNLEIVETEDCGVVIANGDMAAFARAAADILRAPEKARGMAERARQLVRRHFTWERIAEDLENLYRFLRHESPAFETRAPSY